MAFFNKLNPFGAPGLRTLGKSAPIKKLGMSPKPAAPTPGIGPSTNAATGAAQQMGLGGNKPGIMAGQGGQYGKQTFGDPGMQMKRPMRDDMSGGTSLPWGKMRGGGFNVPGGGFNPNAGRPQMHDMRQRSPWEMGGMQEKIKQIQDMMGQQGQLQGTPVGEMGTDISTAESGVMPTPQAQGQAMQQPGAGPSPDMMQQLMQRMGGNRGFGGGMRARFGGGGFGGQQQF